MPWGGCDWQSQVVEGIKNDRTADSIGSIRSIHYDSDDQSYANLKKMCDDRTARIGKRAMQWNTEFGGMYDHWNGWGTDEWGNRTGDAWELATQYMRCLKYDFTAVVYWQLCGNPAQASRPESDHYIMFSTVDGSSFKLGPRYYVARTIYRQLRPGAIKVGCVSDNAEVWALAYRHPVHNTVTILLLNTSSSTQTATIVGPNLPQSFDAYQTSPAQNCVKTGPVALGGTISLPVRSITALYNTPANTVQTKLLQEALRVIPAAGSARPCRLDGRMVPVVAEGSRLPAGTAVGAYLLDNNVWQTFMIVR